MACCGVRPCTLTSSALFPLENGKIDVKLVVDERVSGISRYRAREYDPRLSLTPVDSEHAKLTPLGAEQDLSAAWIRIGRQEEQGESRGP